ncbi:hypothetical protein EV175_001498, partial [Coemansia sp. RSA 1933]
MPTLPDNTDPVLSTPKSNRGGKKRNSPDSDQIATLRRKKRSAHSSDATDDPAPSFIPNSNEDSNYDHNLVMESTPMKSKPSHSNSKDNLSKPLSPIREEREEYAKLQVGAKLRADRAVADIARPRVDVLAGFTTNVAQRVTQRLERTLASDDSNDEYAHLAKWTRQDNHEKETPMYPWISAFFGLVSREIAKAHTEFTAAAR